MEILSAEFVKDVIVMVVMGVILLGDVVKLSVGYWVHVGIADLFMSLFSL